MTPTTETGRRVRAAGVTVSLLLLTFAHVTAPPEQHELHALLFNVGFVPLILAGLWFHVRGAIVAGVLTTVMSLTHLFGQLAPHHAEGAWSTVGLIVLYNVVALTTGLLSQRRDQALARAEAHAEAVEKNARALLRAEEAMAKSERLRALGELSAGLAHEICNPLGGIRGAAEVLAKAETPAPVRREFAKLMDDEIVRLDRVVRNFLQFAKPGAPQVVRVRLAEVVDAVFLLVRTDARQHDVVLDNAVPDDVVAHADADHLRQILLNLTLNAIQAQPDGGRVVISARRAGKSVQVDVEDGGPGVAEALRERVFDPFVTSRPEGSGLGLAIAQRLAGSLGGVIELLATGPRGTTFRVSVPGPELDHDRVAVGATGLVAPVAATAQPQR